MVYDPYMDDEETHSVCYVSQPKGWVLYMAHETPDRLIVFVHGFGGKSTKTWEDFASSGKTDSWWRKSDMLFVSYRSTRENINGVANRLRENLPKFYPLPRESAIRKKDAHIRDGGTIPYSELLLVGHSLGGLIIRRAIADAVRDWVLRGSTMDHPIIFDSKVRLFSPAISGVRFAGLLGIISAMPNLARVYKLLYQFLLLIRI